MEVLIVLGIIIAVVVFVKKLNNRETVLGDGWQRSGLVHRNGGHEPGIGAAPRPTTSDDFEIVRRASGLEQDIAIAVNGKYSGGPIITLVSGERLVVGEVLLYDVTKVAEINSLKAQAGVQLQGFTTGLGFWGSPGWVVGGALALGAVEGMISNAKQKAGLRLLQVAADKFNQLPNNSVFVSVDRIRGLQTPDPQSWSATSSIGSIRFIHNGEDFVTVRTADADIIFRWSQVASYVSPRAAQPPPMPLSVAA